MADSFINPPEELESRDYTSLDQVPAFVKEQIHKEVSGANTGGYCALHHSIETRSTMVNHEEYIFIKAKDLRGETPDETWAKILIVFRKNGHFNNLNQLRSIFFRKLQSHSDKIRGKKGIPGKRSYLDLNIQTTATPKYQEKKKAPTKRDEPNEQDEEQALEQGESFSLTDTPKKKVNSRKNNMKKEKTPKKSPAKNKTEEGLLRRQIRHLRRIRVAENPKQGD